MRLCTSTEICVCINFIYFHFLCTPQPRLGPSKARSLPLRLLCHMGGEDPGLWGHLCCLPVCAQGKTG